MRVISIAAAGSVLFLAGTVHADALKPIKPIDSCALKTGDQQIACLTTRLNAANQSLDTTIAAIRSHFPAGASYAASFDLSHDAWVKEAIQTCRAAAMARSEDTGGAFDLRCRIGMTTAREQLLKTLYAG